MFKLFRKDTVDFFELLSKQSALTTQGIEELQVYFKNPTDASANKIKDIEGHADEARRILIDELNKTFATPMDREDIFGLSRVIDDIVDYGKTTVDEMVVLQVNPTEHLVAMSEILLSGTKEVNNSVLRLKNNPNISMEHAVRAKNFENQMEHIYRQAILELFKGKDIIYMLKMREIYRHLSNAADRCDEAANIISDIVVKMA
ncbi:MAG: DUF47 family protein [Candidatus Firestonebacteria bacterium]